MGHPDKLADQVSDGVLDALLAQDPNSRVACETMVTTGVAIIAGEITSKANIDYQSVVREAIRDAGYTDDAMGISADTRAVMVSLDKQSPSLEQPLRIDIASRHGDETALGPKTPSKVKSSLPCPPASEPVGTISQSGRFSNILLR